jgi:hypothetical protein
MKKAVTFLIFILLLSEMFLKDRINQKGTLDSESEGDII